MQAPSPRGDAKDVGGLCAAITTTPGQRRLLFCASAPARQTPIPKAMSNRSWIVMTVSIPGRTGEPVAVSSLIH
jgi:hypothetical protein